jgi:hypothetical protein
MKKAVLFWVSLVLFAGFVYSVPTDDQIRQAAGTLGVPFADLKSFVESYQPQNTKADVIIITATDLYSAYKANQVRADSQYKNKTVKITGKVTGIKQDFKGNYIELEGPLTVWVYIKLSETSRAISLDISQMITLIGTCDGYNGVWVTIKDATFSK